MIEEETGLLKPESRINREVKGNTFNFQSSGVSIAKPKLKQLSSEVQMRQSGKAIHRLKLLLRDAVVVVVTAGR